MHASSSSNLKVPSPCSLGFLQFDVRLGRIDENLAAVRRNLARLDPSGPGIVVLPELWSAGFDYPNLPQAALETPALLDALAEEARKRNIVLAGSLPEAVLTEVGSSFFNTLFIVGSEGVSGSYRKQQLFAPMAETAHFSAGDNPQPISTPLGKTAALVCFDLRFPELVRQQAGQGAELLIVSAQWPAARRQHWQTLLRARAIENQLFVVACNRCGRTDQTEFAGHSTVISPDGEILVEAGTEEEARFIAIDYSLMGSVRSRFNTVGVSPYRFHDQEKILDMPDLESVVRTYRSIGRTIAFTNGCFDILHEGHVTYLEAARKKADCLIVGLNSDASVRSIKGPERPVNSQNSRARVLAALGCIDHVVLFEEDTPHRLITAIMPDVLIKGGDWPVEKIVGATEVQAAGGRVISIPLVGGHSTTSLINTIRKRG